MIKLLLIKKAENKLFLVLKDETDFIYECSDDSTRAQSAFRISGIIDFLTELDKTTRITEEAVVEEIKEE